MDDTTFVNLRISGWRHFRNVNIEIHDRLTILTGANGSGKSTILNILAPHFAWKPKFSGGGGSEWQRNVEYEVSKRKTTQDANLRYSNRVECSLVIPDSSASSFVTTWDRQQNVNGLFITSHRTPPHPVGVSTIPTSFKDLDQLLSNYIGEQLKRAYPNTTGAEFLKEPPSLRLKQSLISAAVFSQDSQAVKGDAAAKFLWEGFQNALSIMLPKELEFVRLKVESPELYIETRSQRFSIDGVSGGISALIEYAWMILIGSHKYRNYTVCFDEPENHLHPSLQRTLLPSLLKAFPNVNFIVSTHSPFVVTSVRDSNVYALDYVDGEIESRLLDLSNRSLGAEETLRRVLGVPSMLPAWAELELDAAMADFLLVSDKGEALSILRKRLIESGLHEEFPSIVSTLSQRGQI